MLLSLTRELALFVFVGLWYASHIVREFSRDVHDAIVVEQRILDDERERHIASGVAITDPAIYDILLKRNLASDDKILYRGIYRGARTLAALFACVALVSLVLNIVRICKVL